ncbi:hypothetical protein [Paenibacillus apiarius]|uniref:hypothetical protein n=1 Tax=Paenibacillus apiarius TaxID=46240 RepID=UPI003B3B607F
MKWTVFTFEQNEGDMAYYYENEYLDLTHALEFMEFGPEEGFQLAQQLQENRRKRRQAKEENELIKPLYELITRQKTLMAEMGKIKAKAQQTIQTQSKRIYTPRVRTDMQDAFERAKARIPSSGGQNSSF